MQSVLLKWKIMLLGWSMLLLCLSANAENIAMCRESGENIVLKCSSAGCLGSINDYDGMYLYRNFKQEQEEVLYYHPNPQSKDKITPGMRYKDRIQTKGRLENHTITISNLTSNDSGFYSCVYKKFLKGEGRCNVYTVVVKGVAPSHTPDGADKTNCVNQQCPSLVLIITTCAISMLVTMIFTLLIVPRVKRWTCSRRTESTQQASNDYVYEVMTVNRVCPPAAAEQSLLNLNGFA